MLMYRETNGRSRVDHVLFDSFIPCVTDYDIEKQIQEVYTKAQIREFQDELMRK